MAEKKPKGLSDNKRAKLQKKREKLEERRHKLTTRMAEIDALLNAPPAADTGTSATKRQGKGKKTGKKSGKKAGTKRGA